MKPAEYNPARNNPVHDNAECEKIIQGSYQGVLSMTCDDVPYAIPINHGFMNGRLYFHCGLSGRKLDCIRKNPNVVYVITKYYGTPEDFKSKASCHGKWESVIIFGKARIAEEYADIADAFKTFMKCQGKDNFVPSLKVCEEVRAIVVEIERMTARRENEKKERTYFSWERPAAAAE